MADSLSDSERALLSVRADDFHAALLRGAGTDWGPFLEGLPDRIRRAVLTELVIIDLIHRWEHKQRPEVEEYLVRFPELGPADQIPTTIIVEECRCRTKAGEQYDLTRYQDRFPTQFLLIKHELESVLHPPGHSGTVAGSVSGTLIGSSPALPPVVSSGPTPGLSSVANEYEFIKVLGRGVFGEVWRARKKTSGIEKAIKIVTQPEDREASRRERRSLELIKNLRHPYLLSTDDFWVADQRLHIVMELADCTLRDRLEQCRKTGLPGIPEMELIGYLREAAEGLDFLHARHITHRDVKPDNILLLHGHAKVADFGLARQQENKLDAMKTFAGTPAYMAPEIWVKEGGPASDLYSLAVAYVELRQGYPPLMRKQMEDMMIAHLDGVHEFEAIIGEQEQKVLKKALARIADERYPSCLTFVEALGMAMGISTIPRSGVVPEPPRRVLPSESDSQPKGSGVRSMPHSRASGSIGTAEAQKQTHPNNRNRTVVEPSGSAAKSTVAVSPAATGLKTVLGAVLTLVLVSVLAVAIWFLFIHGDPGTHSATTGETPTTPGNGGTPPTPKTQTNPDNGGKKNVDPPPIPVLPPGARPDPAATVLTLPDKRKVYDWIVIPVGDQGVRFRFISGEEGQPPVGLFYVMESKVWNGLYRAGGSVPQAESVANGPDAPVTFVTAEEANAFARSAFVGGRLPSPDEWDYAAGVHAKTGQDEITRPGGRPRGLLAKPEPTHGPNAGTDVNYFDLRDMAGNGREWTRQALVGAGQPEKIVGVNPLTATDRIILRGRNYTLPRGFTFKALEDERKTPLAQYATFRSAYTSFRVVVPVP